MDYKNNIKFAFFSDRILSEGIPPFFSLQNFLWNLIKKPTFLSLNFTKLNVTQDRERRDIQLQTSSTDFYLFSIRLDYLLNFLKKNDSLSNKDDKKCKIKNEVKTKTPQAFLTMTMN